MLQSRKLKIALLAITSAIAFPIYASSITTLNGLTFGFNENPALRGKAEASERRFFKMNPEYVKYLKSEDGEKSRDYLKKHILKNPKDYVALTELMYLYCTIYPLKKSIGDSVPDSELSSIFSKSYDLNSNYYKSWIAISQCGLVDFDNQIEAASIALSLNKNSIDAKISLATGLFGKNRENDALKITRQLETNLTALQSVDLAMMFQEAYSSLNDSLNKNEYRTKSMDILSKAQRSESIPVRRRALNTLIEWHVIDKNWVDLRDAMNSLRKMGALNSSLEAGLNSLIALHQGNCKESIQISRTANHAKYLDRYRIFSSAIACYARAGEYKNVLNLFMNDYPHEIYTSYDIVSDAVDAAKELNREKELSTYLKKTYIRPRQMKLLCRADLRLNPNLEGIATCEQAYQLKDIDNCSKLAIALDLSEAYGKIPLEGAKNEIYFFEEASKNPCAANNGRFYDTLFSKFGIHKREELKSRLEKQYVIYPDSFYAKTYYSRYLSRIEKNYEKALSILKSMDSSSLGGNELYSYNSELIDSYIVNGKRNEAIKVADEYLKKYPSNNSLDLKVHAYALSDGYEKSAKVIVDEVEKNKKIVAAQGYGSSLGVTYAKALLELKRPDDAISVLKAALPQAGDEIPAHNYWIARVYAQGKKDCASAKPYAEKAWKGDAQNVGTWGWNASDKVLDLKLICNF